MDDEPDEMGIGIRFLTKGILGGLLARETSGDSEQNILKTSDLHLKPMYLWAQVRWLCVNYCVR